MDKLKSFIYPFSFLSAEMFSAYCGIIGQEQEEGSSLYLYYMVLVFALSMALIMHDIFVARKPYYKGVWIIFLAFSVCYYFDYTSETTPLEWTTKSYLFFIFFSLPAMLIGSILAKSKNIQSLYKSLDLIVFLLGVGMISYLPKMMYLGEQIKGYNGISYQSALAFGYLYYGLLSKRQDRFWFFKTKLFKVITIVLCILLVLTSLTSGGRGGVVFMIALAGIISFTFVQKSNIMKTIFLYVPMGLLVLFLTTSLVQDSALSKSLNRGIDRAFSYITSSGIDMSQTSNRDIAYEIAMKNIEDSPYIGHGIFHTIGSWGYPHNIFLEIMEGGGVFYLLLWIFVIFKSLRMGYSLVKGNSQLMFLVPICAYPYINLLFSGSYLMTGVFWFALLFIFNYKNEYSR